MCSKILGTWNKQELGVLCLVGELRNDICQCVKRSLHHLPSAHRAAQRLGDKGAHEDVQRLAAVILKARKDAPELF